MEFSQVVRARRSHRKFTPDPVTDEQLTALLEAARRAPSGHNCQPWRFVAVRNRALIDGFCPAVSPMKWSARASALLVVCADPERVMNNVPGDRSLELYALQDTAAAAQNILLCAADLGLGGCWIGVFDEAACLEYFDLPRRWRPVAVLALGRPAGEARERALRPLEDVVTYLD